MPLLIASTVPFDALAPVALPLVEMANPRALIVAPLTVSEPVPNAATALIVLRIVRFAPSVSEPFTRIMAVPLFESYTVV